MILLVDVGNTRSKWAFWDGDEVRLAGSCPTGDWSGLDLGDKPVRLAVVACVAGEQVAANLMETLTARGISIHWLRPAASSHGVVNEYTPPDADCDGGAVFKPPQSASKQTSAYAAAMCASSQP